jgi:hypothetical protein
MKMKTWGKPMPVEWDSGHVWCCHSLQWPVQEHLREGLRDEGTEWYDKLEKWEEDRFDKKVKSLADDFWEYGAAAAPFGQCFCNT